jgi:hypothetical protein
MCGIAGNDEDRGRSRIHGMEERERSSIGRVLDGRTIKMSGDVVCGLHCVHRDDERVFLG